MRLWKFEDHLRDRLRDLELAGMRISNAQARALGPDDILENFLSWVGHRQVRKPIVEEHLVTIDRRLRFALFGLEC